jgi:DNA primase
MILATNSFNKMQEAVSLEDVIERVLPDVEVVPAGKAKKTVCPFHDDHDPSLHLFPDGRFHCFVCRASGDAVDLYAHVKNIASSV